MSMTGRWIDQLNEQARMGDLEAQETLRNAGLWETEEEAAVRERKYEMLCAGEGEVDEEDSVLSAEIIGEITSDELTDEDIPW